MKQRIRPNISVGGTDPLENIIRMATDNPETFMRRATALIEEGGLGWEHFGDLRRMFLGLADIQVPANVSMLGTTRSIQASAFPLLAGALVANQINEKMDAIPTIGEQLVTEVQDNKRISVYGRTIVMTTDKGKDGVPEGQAYPEIGASEEKYEIRSKRQGYSLSITAETIEENNAPDIVAKCDALAEISTTDVEEQTIMRVCDVHGSGGTPAEPYVLRLAGSGTSLFSTTANTPTSRAPSGTRIENNPLVDDASLETARARLALMVDDRGKRIYIPMSRCVLLVPDGVVTVALKIVGSEMVPGVDNEQNQWGPRGAYRPKLVSSPVLDSFSTGAWYLGMLKEQYKRKWKLTYEYVTLTGNTQEFLTKRVAFQARIGFDVEIGATDVNRVVQSLPASTAPSV